MTPAEFSAALKSLGLSDPQAAALLHYTGKHRRQQVYKMRTGAKPITPDKAAQVQAWLSGYRPDDWPL